MKRKVIVQIQTANGTKEFDGIDVKFNITKVMSSIMNEAHISICNLTKDDIEYLTTFTSEFIAIQERKRIRIFAGYEETGVSLIFDGDIARAIPTMPPDVWLECKALSGYYSNKEMISMSLKGSISVNDVCTACASELGLPIINLSTVPKMITDFAFTGDKWKLIGELNDLGGISAWEDNGTLYVANEKTPRNDIVARELSENSGMIGVPKVDPIGIEVTLLLDNSLQIGQTVILNSQLFKQANGNYYIYEIKHDGHLRGNNFQTIIKARRVNNVLT